jgi:hypothetical protein
MALRSLNESNIEVIKGFLYVTVYTQMDKLLGKVNSDGWSNYKLRKAKEKTELFLSTLTDSQKKFKK